MVLYGRTNDLPLPPPPAHELKSSSETSLVRSSLVQDRISLKLFQSSNLPIASHQYQREIRRRGI
jgi:hypothetical protein